MTTIEAGTAVGVDYIPEESRAVIHEQVTQQPGMCG